MVYGRFTQNNKPGFRQEIRAAHATFSGAREERRMENFIPVATGGPSESRSTEGGRHYREELGDRQFLVRRLAGYRLSQKSKRKS